MKRAAAIVVALAAALAGVGADDRPSPEWSRLEGETLQHFQALLRLDTSSPPGNESRVAEYLERVLAQNGIASKTFTLQAGRTNLVARLPGSGRKRPILLMGHTDVVTVDPAKWTHPPFAAERDGGYVYGRGAVDDRDNVVAALMTMLVLKRLQVPLDRDVIFLAEAGEEGSPSVGIDFLIERHLSEIDAEYCLAEGGGVTREGGTVTFAEVQTLEKAGRAIELVARGTAGHGSVPLSSNAIVHLAGAVARVGAWRPPVRLNETTRAYFERLAAISGPNEAARFRAVTGPNPEAADTYFLQHAPRFASMLRTSFSATMVQGGYRVNVIPSEARATFDVRMLPDEDPARLLDAVRAIVDDPAVEVRFAERETRPIGPSVPLDTEAFRAIEAAVTRHYATVTLPTMATAATDMAQARAAGMRCYGIGPATDVEDGPLGFGAHSDQERILESELHRFVRFTFDVVHDLAAAR